MNNFQILICNDVFFIKTNASKKDIIKLTIKFYLLKKLKLFNKSLIKFIQYNGFFVKDLIHEKHNLYEILKTNNYRIINLMKIDEYFKYSFCSEQ